jgi:hypothetical protein
MKTLVTAADRDNGSNEDDTKACLGFLVYLFAGSASRRHYFNDDYGRGGHKQDGHMDWIVNYCDI